jgi:HSP20 family protein
MDEGQLSVVIDGDMLVIRGERPDALQAEKRSYHEARIPYGAFGADVYIPFPVDADRTEAEYSNGFLRIVLPRSSARTIVPRRPEGEAGRGEGAR